MKMMKFIFLAVLGLMAGCKSEDNSLALLRGQEWELKSMTDNGQVVTNPQELPTLVFSDSTAVYGSAGCNRFFGTYESKEKGKITVKPGGATMMYCPDMAFEDQYLKALPKVDKFTVNASELKLEGDAGKLQIVYTPVDASKKKSE